MTASEQAAIEMARSAGVIPNDSSAFVDPAAIAVFLELFRQLAECFSRGGGTLQQNADTVRRPGLFQKIALRIMIKRTLDASDFANRREFRAMINNIHAAALAYGRSIDADTLAKLIEENA